MKRWLLRSEPEHFSFGDLLVLPAQMTAWEGVRNFQARNFLREMKPGEPVLFYHSSTKTPGGVGLAEVASESYPDPTQFDPESPYFDAKATREEPRWWLVDIKGIRALPRLVSLQELRADARLKGMRLLEQGNRLSVTPVTQAEFQRVLELADLARSL